MGGGLRGGGFFVPLPSVKDKRGAMGKLPTAEIIPSTPDTGNAGVGIYPLIPI